MLLNQQAVLTNAFEITHAIGRIGNPKLWSQINGSYYHYFDIPEELMIYIFYLCAIAVNDGITLDTIIHYINQN